MAELSLSTTSWTTILDASTGNLEARNRLASRYRPVVHSFISKQFFTSRFTREDVDDLTQEVFLALTKPGALREVDPAKGRFRSWLFQVIRNVVYDQIRKRSAAKRSAPGRSASREPVAPADSLEAAFDQEFFAALLGRALARFGEENPRYRDAIKAAYVEGLSHAELAARLGISKTAVNSLLAHAREKMKGIVRGEIRGHAFNAADFREDWARLRERVPWLRS